MSGNPYKPPSDPAPASGNHPKTPSKRLSPLGKRATVGVFGIIATSSGIYASTTEPQLGFFVTGLGLKLLWDATRRPTENPTEHTDPQR